MIDHAMVRKLASAARIDLAREEVERIAGQLTDILEQIAPLADMVAADEARVARERAASGEAETQAVPSDAPLHPSEAQPLRADIPGADILHGTLGRFAPEVRAGFFTVPRLPTHGGTQ